MSIIFPVRKHRKFWIISNFATTGKRYILASYMVACSGRGIKNNYILLLKKTCQRKGAEKKCTKKLTTHHGKVHNHGV